MKNPNEMKFGVPALITPEAFRLPSEYQEIGIVAILEAWGISYTSLENGKIRLFLPEGWEAKYYKYEGMSKLRTVYDSDGNHRMTVHGTSVEIKLPVTTHLDGEYSVPSGDYTTMWVEVQHLDKVVFRSTGFEPEKEPDLYLDDEADETFPSVEDPDPYQTYRDEADAFMREHYPLLCTDPNAYW